MRKLCCLPTLEFRCWPASLDPSAQALYIALSQALARTFGLSAMDGSNNPDDPKYSCFVDLTAEAIADFRKVAVIELTEDDMKDEASATSKDEESRKQFREACEQGYAFWIGRF
jgi:hypothetical protein